MAFSDCIRSARDQGKLGREEAVELTRRFDALVRELGGDAAKAKQTLLTELVNQGREKQRLALLGEQARIKLVENLQAFRTASGKPDYGRAYMYLVESFGEAKFQDVENLKLAIVGRAHAKLDGLLAEFKRHWLLGDMNRKGGSLQVRMDNVVRELFGQKSGDEVAAGFAKSIGEVFEDLRVRFNEKGGSIGKLDKWGLPQLHSKEKVVAYTKPKWIEYMMGDGVLDRERMIDWASQRPMSDEQLTEALGRMWDRIRSDGWIDREPSQKTPYKALFEQHADHRFIHFKGADQWLAYDKQFGHGDPFDAMIGHVYMMARDISAMEVFGPNPDAMRTYLKQWIERQLTGVVGPIDPGESRALDRARTWINRADQMWEMYRGRAHAPVNATFATTMAATREFITATRLGGAMLSALGDLATQTAARAFVGMEAGRSNPFSVVMGIGQLMKGARRGEAVRAGLIMDANLQALQQQARYDGTLHTRTITGFLSDRAIALQGLSAWTQAIKHSFGWEFQGFMADLAGTTWDKLPENARRTLDRHGFNRDSWNQIRQVQLYEPETGAKFLRPQEIEAAAGREMADKYMSMIYREGRYATIESTLRSRSFLLGDTRPGTAGGELTRSFAQFKSFALTYAMMHGGRIAREIGAGRGANGALYAGAMLITGTMFGAISMMLKDIAAGRDPRKWQDEKTFRMAEFWAAAAAQGGGLGIYGDFLFSDVNRFGGGLVSTVAGPTVGMLNDLRNLTIGNGVQVLRGALGESKDTNAGRELTNFIRGNTPLLSSLWYAKLAYNRILVDQLQYQLDPDARAAWHRQEAKRQRDYGQQMYWPSGQMAPTHWPDANVVGP